MLSMHRRVMLTVRTMQRLRSVRDTGFTGELMMTGAVIFGSLVQRAPRWLRRPARSRPRRLATPEQQRLREERTEVRSLGIRCLTPRARTPVRRPRSGT